MELITKHLFLYVSLSGHPLDKDRIYLFQMISKQNKLSLIEAEKN